MFHVEHAPVEVSAPFRWTTRNQSVAVGMDGQHGEQRRYVSNPLNRSLVSPNQKAVLAALNTNRHRFAVLPLSFCYELQMICFVVDQV